MTTAPALAARLVADPARRVRRLLAVPFVGDALLAAAFFGVWCLATSIALTLGWYPFDLSSYYAVGGIAAGALLLGRRLPLVGIVVAGVLCAWPEWYFAQPEIRVVPIVLAAFLATSSGLRLRFAAPVTALFAWATLWPTYWVFYGVFTGREIFSVNLLDVSNPSLRILCAIVVVVSLLLGATLRSQRTAVRALSEKNAELVRLRDADMARAASEERVAVARDIHDVVAHHVAAMVIRAQAADRVADSRPDELRTAVRWIASSGQEALASMRQVVRVLRSTGSDVDRIDFAQAIGAIVARVSETGLVVDSHIQLDGPLGAEQEAAALRITQEALTNVMLHSSARRARVGIRGVGGALELVVEDDGGTAEQRTGSVVAAGLSDGASSGGGNGIPGMRERVEQFGGTLEAAGLPSGGWRVHASLPAAGSAA
jgi:signal transduction histidine kinase